MNHVNIIKVVRTVGFVIPSISLIIFALDNFIKKGSLAQVFSCEFSEIFKNTFFTEHLWMTAPGLSFLMLQKRSI